MKPNFHYRLYENTQQVPTVVWTHPFQILPHYSRKITPFYGLFSGILTYLLTYYMEKSLSWESNWSAASQEILRILWNPKVHHRSHKRTPPVPILSQLHPVHTPTTQVFQQKWCIYLSSLITVPHVPHISTFLFDRLNNHEHVKFKMRLRSFV